MVRSPMILSVSSRSTPKPRVSLSPTNCQDSRRAFPAQASMTPISNTMVVTMHPIMDTVKVKVKISYAAVARLVPQLPSPKVNTPLPVLAVMVLKIWQAVTILPIPTLQVIKTSHRHLCNKV